MILGWTAVVGITLAVFSGTISLGEEKRVRANRRRRSSRRVRRNASTGPTFGWSRYGGLYRRGNWAFTGSSPFEKGDLVWWDGAARTFLPVSDNMTLEQVNQYIDGNTVA
jgi:hypothetical protein